MEISIRIENIKEIERFLETRPVRMREELNRAVKKSVLSVERQTKINSPVDTGLMRTSVNSRTYRSEIAGEVIAGVRYAIYVHEGTYKMRARPFMARAVKTMRSNIQRFFKEAIKRALEK